MFIKFKQKSKSRFVSLCQLNSPLIMSVAWIDKIEFAIILILGLNSTQVNYLEYLLINAKLSSLVNVLGPRRNNRTPYKHTYSIIERE